MDALCPAPKVQGTLVEQLAAAGREEVGGEEDKRIGPHQEGMFYTPPPVIVEMTLHMCMWRENMVGRYVCTCLCVCVCVLCVIHAEH